jgi:cell pole-organizing protein PopZ
MSQAAAKAQEPSMEEILASIRRIIADDKAAKPAPRAPVPEAGASAAPVAPPSAATEANAATREPVPMSQVDIDAVLAGFQAPTDGTAQASPSPAEQRSDVLGLTEALRAAAPASPAFRTVEPELESGPARLRLREAARPHSPVHEVEERPLLSDRATAAVTAAFGTLAHTVLTQKPRTLDDLVQEALRSMLKSWLDDNLPTIVERLVRAEIERVSRGRG